MLQKYGRHGTPKYHYFRLSSNDDELQWESKNVRVCCPTTSSSAFPTAQYGPAPASVSILTHSAAT